MLGTDLAGLFMGPTYPVLLLILLCCLSPLLPRVGLSNSLFLAKPVSHCVSFVAFLRVPYIKENCELWAIQYIHAAPSPCKDVDPVHLWVIRIFPKIDHSKMKIVLEPNNFSKKVTLIVVTVRW